MHRSHHEPHDPSDDGEIVRRRTPSTHRTRRRPIVLVTGCLAAIGSVGALAPSVSASANTARAEPARVAPAVEVLDLGCEARNSRDHDAPRDADGDVVYGVACRWTIPTVDTAAGVRLLRIVVGSGQPRETVFATRDLTQNRHLDAPVRPDHRYAYRVQALSRAGRVVASSRTVVVGVPSVQVEPLRLECQTADGAPAPGETRVRIGCRWSQPATARILTLWRSVDGGARERVASFTHPFPSSYRDVVPASTSRVVYAVIGTDGDGDIVARSRAEVVEIPHVRATASAAAVAVRGPVG